MKNRQIYIVAFVAGALMLGGTACNNDDPELVKTEPVTVQNSTAAPTDSTTTETIEPNEYTGYSHGTDDINVAKGNNHFAFDLFKLINGGISEATDKNVFFSPMSLTMCMSMLANGAQGVTQSDLLSLLHQDDLTTLNTINAKLLNVMPGLDNTTQISFANGIWAREDYPLKSNYIVNNIELYKAQVTNFSSDLNVTSTINQWVSDKTNGMITDFLNPGSANSPTYLVDAVYFKGIWNKKFENTEVRSFQNYDNTTTDATYMLAQETYSYAETDICQYLDMAFGNGSFRFVIALPKDGYSIADLADNYEAWYNAPVNDTEVTLSVPRISISTSYDKMQEYFEGLGIITPFDNNADYSAMCDKKLLFNTVIHKAKIDLDENGAVSVAATGTHMVLIGEDTSNIEPKNVVMNVDHPFIFTIYDKTSGSIVFMGAVNKL